MAEAVNTVCFILYRQVSRSCKRECTTFEVIHGHRPDTSYLRKFGCEAVVHKPKSKRNDKSDSSSEPGMFVDYCNGEAYRVLLADGKAIAEERMLP